MTTHPRQPMPLLIGGVALAGAAALAWLGLGQLGQRQAEAQALADRLGNPALAALLADPAGLARAKQETVELQKLEKELWEREGSLATQWSEETGKISGDGQDWASDPGKWKDKLVAVQSELQQSAPQQRVQLAPDFYLGLDPFRQKSPAPEEVPALALHLSVAKRLVELLFQARKVAEQYPTACEFRSLMGPGSVAEKAAPPAEAAPRPGAPPAGPERITFRAEIQCSPEVLYEYVRLLSEDPALLILTNLAVQNERQTFPLRSEIAKKFSENESPPAGTPEAAPQDKKLLEILAGEESLSAILDLDFVAWRNPAATKGKAEQATAP